MIALKEVLVADDFSAISRDALAYATDLARMFDARLHILHVLDNFFMRPVVADVSTVEARAGEQLRDRLRDNEQNGIEGTSALITSDDPAASIVDYAKRKHIDLIVLGTHGRHSIDRLLMGSVAEHVVRAASCPVLTVRPNQCAGVVSETEVAAASG